MSTSLIQLTHTQQSFALLLQARAEQETAKIACYFLYEDKPERSLTYGELHTDACRVAAALCGAGCNPGDPVIVIMAYPSGFVPAFAGVFYADAVAVPLEIPRPGRGVDKILSVLRDCKPRAILTERITETAVRAALPEQAPPVIVIDTLSDGGGYRLAATRRGEDLALLQYTSGSTSIPKGVMVTYDNMFANADAISRAFHTSRDISSVSWLPLFHDMGLMKGLVEPVVTGYPIALMPPAAFVAAPFRWLEAMSRFRAANTGGPNFGYELCIRKISSEQRDQLDLSAWRVAFNGAETVRADTLERFYAMFAPAGLRLETLYPCYGLAEATLKVSGGPFGRAPRVLPVLRSELEHGRAVPAATVDDRVLRLVSCGPPVHNTLIRIVDPERAVPVPDRIVGEIWVAGPGIARGYLGRDAENEATFRARLVEDDGHVYLRTGDLGFLDEGDLFVTGRIKNLIKIDGRNYYPQDIEAIVETAHSAIRPGCTAAFSAEINDEEHLIVAAEVSPEFAKQNLSQPSEVASLVRAIRATVVRVFGVRVHDVVVGPPGLVPKTSSGKVQHNACREHYLSVSRTAARPPHES